MVGAVVEGGDGSDVVDDPGAATQSGTGSGKVASLITTAMAWGPGAPHTIR